jgi:hypothetical protein
VIYGASWDGDPVRLFSTRPESPESSPLMLPNAEVLSISRSGQMAVSLDRRWAGRFIWSGTLAQVPLLGGAPRELADDVQWADWSPDGSSLAVVLREAGKARLEYPSGNVLYETAGWISHPRVSPRGDLVAFLDHPVLGDDYGSVATVDRQRKVATLSSEWVTAYGLAWLDDAEVLFTGTRVGVARAIWTVSLAGQERLLARTPGELTIQDAGTGSRLLMTSDNGKVGIAVPPSDPRRSGTLTSDRSLVRDLSGRPPVALRRVRGRGRARACTCARRTVARVRLGDGTARNLARRALGLAVLRRPGSSSGEAGGNTSGSLPTKAGQPKFLPAHGLNLHRASWMPDGKRVLLAANEPGGAVRLYSQSLTACGADHARRDRHRRSRLARWEDRGSAGGWRPLPLSSAEQAESVASLAPMTVRSASHRMAGPSTASDAESSRPTFSDSTSPPRRRLASAT